MFGKSKTTTVAPEELQGAEGVQILDVRDHEEWTAGHIDGTLHVPMADVGGQLEWIEKGRPVVTVCRSGQRSGKVAKLLAVRGYDAANLRGGLQAWTRAGLPLRAADDSPGRVA